jgi:hypothetical protein
VEGIRVQYKYVERISVSGFKKAIERKYEFRVNVGIFRDMDKKGWLVGLCQCTCGGIDGVEEGKVKVCIYTVKAECRNPNWLKILLQGYCEKSICMPVPAVFLLGDWCDNCKEVLAFEEWYYDHSKSNLGQI